MISYAAHSLTMLILSDLTNPVPVSITIKQKIFNYLPFQYIIKTIQDEHLKYIILFAIIITIYDKIMKKIIFQ